MVLTTTALVGFENSKCMDYFNLSFCMIVLDILGFHVNFKMDLSMLEFW